MKKKFINSDAFQDVILTAMREKVPQNTNLARILMDILFIEKEAVYRRLRREVPFTFQETVIIAKELGVSLDAIIGIDTEKCRPFQIQLVEYANPLEVDYSLLDSYGSLLDSAGSDPYSELIMSTNTIPQPIYTGYDYLSRFFMFKWAYHHADGPVKSFEKINIPERLKEVLKRLGAAHKQIETTNYIFDNQLILYLVNDIQYFARIGLIPEEDVSGLKTDLHEMLDYFEKLAENACFETGKNVNRYVSNINLDTTYTCLRIYNHRLSLINAFILNTTASMDKDIYEKARKWILSIRRLSSLISQSGELQKIQFIKQQRMFVDML